MTKNQNPCIMYDCKNIKPPVDKFFDSPVIIGICWGVLIFAILYVAWLVLRAVLKHF